MKILSTIYGYYLSNLTAIHNGIATAKLKASMSLAFSISPIAYALEKITHWTLVNETYVLFVLTAIVADHMLGTIIHALVKRDFSFKKNIVGLITKIGLVVIVGFLFEGINQIIKEDLFVKTYLVIVLRLAVFLYPAGSALMNSAVLSNNKIPPVGFINKFNKFNKNLNIDELKNNTNK